MAGLFAGMRESMKMAMLLHMEQHPKSPMPLFAFLRRWKPNLVLGSVAVATKFEDVQEVLRRSDAFRVTLYPPRMEPMTGPTPLVMDDTPEYWHDRSALCRALSGTDVAPADVAALKRAISPEDSSRILDFAYRAASRIVADAASRTPRDRAVRLDLVRELANVVPIRLCGDYFGTPGLDERTQLYWARTLFYEMFIVQDTPVISKEARASTAAWKAYVYGMMARRRADVAAGAPVPDDIMGRLLGEQPETELSDDRICGNLIHMMVGFIPQMSKVTALAVQELIDRPRELAEAQKAARADDDDTLRGYVWEALRFNAHPAILLRQCARDADYVLARGTRRATRIPAGALTVAVLQSAMFDSEVLDHPEKFLSRRPWEQYLFFGYGQHQCLGQHISRLAVPMIAKPLLRRYNLRRARGAAGRMRWDRVFPDQLIVTFDPE